MKSLAGILIIAVVMGWTATMTIPAATIAPDEATLKLLPPETEAVAFIDVAALRGSSLVQAAMANKLWGGELERELGEFVTATGFDPRQDLDQITVAKIGSKQVLMIARGQYDRFKVEQFVKDKSAGRISSEAYMGRTIYTERDRAFSFIDSLVIAGHGNAVKKVIDQMSLPGSLPLRADLMDQIRSIEASSQVWAVGDVTVKDLPRSLRGPAPTLEMMNSLRSGTYQMRVDADVHARAVGTFSDADAARNLSDLARGFIALAKLQVAKEQDLMLLLDGIQVSSSGLTVVVNIDQPGELLKKLPSFNRN